MSHVVLLVELKLVAGQKEKFLARARQHRAKVLDSEADCHRFDLLAPEEGADIVFLCEEYTDAAALEFHLNTPYMKQYLAETAPMIAERTRTLCNLANG